jgi:hypothetical protein
VPVGVPQEQLEFFEILTGRGGAWCGGNVATTFVAEHELAVLNGGAECAFVNHAVMAGAHEHEVGEAGRPSFGPTLDMVSVEVLFTTAAGDPTTAVAQPQGTADRLGDRASAAADVQQLAVRSDHDLDPRAVAREHLRGVDRHGRAVP